MLEEHQRGGGGWTEVIAVDGLARRRPRKVGNREVGPRIRVNGDWWGVRHRIQKEEDNWEYGKRKKDHRWIVIQA